MMVLRKKIGSNLRHAVHHKKGKGARRALQTAKRQRNQVSDQKGIHQVARNIRIMSPERYNQATKKVHIKPPNRYISSHQKGTYTIIRKVYIK